MKNRNGVRVALMVLSIGLASLAQADFFKNKATGTLQVTVLDEDGKVVQDAPVYIFGEHRTRFIGGNETQGTAMYRMEAGHYRVSSALVEDRGDSKNRFASLEAHVEIVPGDNTSVILTLRPIRDPFASARDYSQAGHIIQDNPTQPL